MSSLPRTIRNIWRSGIKDTIWQLATVGDTKAGRLVGTDKFGNRFYQNDEEELPLRTRWVKYKNFYGDAAEIEPGWHAWISYATDNLPTDPIYHNAGFEKWGKPLGFNPTQSRGAYKPYSTVKPKVAPWEPKVAVRG